ncbi:MAG TPA: hypothetical protein VM050_00835 [Patescibacteria group bacterium]|nr:hypothetical protein [Patescibacteria group bacterium]
MSDEKNREVELLFEIVKHHYGDKIEPDELEEVRKGVERVIENAEKLRAIKLQNGNEPFSIFRPYRKER